MPFPAKMRPIEHTPVQITIIPPQPWWPTVGEAAIDVFVDIVSVLPVNANVKTHFQGHLHLFLCAAALAFGKMKPA